MEGESREVGSPHSSRLMVGVAARSDVINLKGTISNRADPQVSPSERRPSASTLFWWDSLFKPCGKG